jgi:hypothetical protein
MQLLPGAHAWSHWPQWALLLSVATQPKAHRIWPSTQVIPSFEGSPSSIGSALHPTANAAATNNIEVRRTRPFMLASP